ncbi:ankyrin repeat, partial [Fusarium albosuccineum]
MSKNRFQLPRNNSFVTEFLDEDTSPATSASNNGRVAIATDNARQIVGNIITYYSEPSQSQEMNRKWLKVIEWLSPSKEILQTQKLVHRDAKESRIKGTGSWFLTSPEFHRWLYGPDTLRWVHGIVGCGKTVLFSTAVEKAREVCRSDSSKLSAFFYCTSRDPSSQDINVLLKFLIIQLYSPSNDCEPLGELYSLYNQTFPPQLPTATELLDSLKSLLRQSTFYGSCESHSSENAKTIAQRTIYILIDGLDEVPLASRGSFLQLTSTLAALKLPHVHLLVTSRNQPDIWEAMSWPTYWSHVAIDNDMVQNDINHYVSYTINEDIRLFNLPETTKDTIKTKVSDEGRGMFLWASLQLKALMRLRVMNINSVLAALRSLPKDLDETYYRILDEIDASFVPQASNALKWLALSTRPLYLEELVDACAIDLQLSPVLGESISPYNIFEMLHDLILVQPPFVQRNGVIIPKTHRISLFHATVGEFLRRIDTFRPPDSGSILPVSDFRLRDDEAHFHIAQSCLAYLYYYNTADARNNRPALCDYAFYNWDKHLDHKESETGPNLGHRDAGVRRKAMALYHDLPFRRDLYSGWLHSQDVSRLMEAVNSPVFHINFDSFFLSSDKVTAKSGLPQAKCFEPENCKIPHHPLDESRNEVRFIELLPCLDKATDIRARMYTASLDQDPPRYAVISQNLNLRHKKEPTYLNGYEFPVPPAQAQLLRVLRLRGEDSPAAIWMDGICVNLSNDMELKYHVNLITRIYAEAQDVIFGFREFNSYDIQPGMNVLTRLAALSRDHLASKPNPALFTPRDLSAMLALFNSTLWQDRWRVQEVVLSANIILLIGSLSCNFNLIEQAMDAEPRLERFLDPPGRCTLFLLKNHAGWLAAKRLIQTRSQWAICRGLPLPALLWRFRNSKCMHEHDKVYSLLSLCTKQDEHSLNIDYEKDPHVLFREVSAYIISAYNSLDILSLRCAWINDSLLASWALDLQQPSGIRPLILGVFEWPRQPDIYTACGTHGYWASVPSDSLSDSTLQVKGQCFDTVRHVLDLSNAGPPTVQRMCQKISSIQDQTVYAAESHVEIRWRTLLADQWPVGQRLGQNIFRGAPIPTCPEDEAILFEQPDLIADMPFLQGRSILLTTGGYLGLGPDGAEPGDEVAVLAGGAVSYILRKHDHKYKLIGDCYVHGCMDGEVISRIYRDGGDIDSWAQIIKIVARCTPGASESNLKPRNRKSARKHPKSVPRKSHNNAKPTEVHSRRHILARL